MFFVSLSTVGPISIMEDTYCSAWNRAELQKEMDR